MPLADLKKKRPTPSHKPLSVDDFIDGALDYASGRQTPMAANTVTRKSSAKVTQLRPQQMTLIEDRAPQKKPVDVEDKSKFIHVSYTITSSALAQLNANSQRHSMAKSRLLRVLLQHFDSLPPIKQSQLLQANAVR
ncbi:hypothetical protein [Paraferrimonas haliotis]|uniref:Replication protein RepA n=1 Tax=Paraferrimonas haliotis TaxID=2013866 RepID=A0AA37TVB8_9GAMM|nr:hypothetical protein [Paraferrimonas haliotis]GLS83529.1 replication protein RepA [Paraferrimonas haliotis]